MLEIFEALAWLGAMWLLCTKGPRAPKGSHALIPQGPLAPKGLCILDGNSKSMVLPAIFTSYFHSSRV